MDGRLPTLASGQNPAYRSTRPSPFDASDTLHEVARRCARRAPTTCETCTDNMQDVRDEDAQNDLQRHARRRCAATHDDVRNDAFDDANRRTQLRTWRFGAKIFKNFLARLTCVRAFEHEHDRIENPCGVRESAHVMQVRRCRCVSQCKLRVKNKRRVVLTQRRCHRQPDV